MSTGKSHIAASLRALLQMKQGQHIYVQTTDARVQQFASLYGLEIKTERMYSFKAKNPSKLEKLVRVTLIGRKEGQQW